MTDLNKTYYALRAGGLSEDAVWAVMGNFNCESNLEPCRVQGDFRPGYPASRSYAEAVDSGVKSKEAFAADGKGWGLAQWTYPSRKRALWDCAKAKNRSIADLELQLHFLLKELKEDFASLYRFLQTTDNLYEATDRFCREFENPAVKNVNARYSSAQWLRSNTKLTPSESRPEALQGGSPSPEGKTVAAADGGGWPPRMICTGMNGLDVTLLQVLLTLRGYGCSVSGEFTKETEKKLRQFQADSDSLMIDGIAGPLTWAEIMQYK